MTFEDLLPVIVIIAATLFIVFAFRRKPVPKQDSFDFHGGDSPNRFTEAQRLRETIDKLQLELQTFGRESHARLDTRIRLLNRLIEESDEKIRKLENLISLQEDGEGPVSRKSTSDNHKTAPKNPINQQVVELSKKGLSKVEIAKKTGLEIGEIELILNIQGG